MSIIIPGHNPRDYTQDELANCVYFQNGPPCLIVDTDGEDAVIRNIVTGEQYLVPKRDLIEGKYYIR